MARGSPRRERRGPRADTGRRTPCAEPGRSLIDRGQAAIAAAEEVAFGGTTLDEPLDRRVAAARVAEVTGGPWWRSCGPSVVVAVPRADARSSSARRRGGAVEIRLTDGQLTAATVAHELAHALAGIEHGHDETFRAAYVDVVALLAGEQPGAALRAALAGIGLAIGARRWPRPHRAVGEDFVVIPG